MALMNWLRSGRETRKAADALYAALLARARAAVFYAELGVPDSVDGRFDMIVLHMCLLLGRLKQGDEDARRLAQALFDLMFRDMDRSVRELGAGDHAIGRRIKQMISAFYGRARAYDEALPDPARLAEALRRNVYRSAEVDEAALSRLAAYVVEAHRALAAEPLESLLQGELPPAVRVPGAGHEMH